jgi:SAM-dependent methyltransferase
MVPQTYNRENGWKMRNLKDLMRKFLRRDERMLNIDYFYRQPGVNIDLETTKEEEKELFERVARVWTNYGNVDPYWSVITSPQFKASQIDAQGVENFYSSGAGSANLIQEFFARSGNTQTRGTCLELGAGVGRVTNHLSLLFDKVIAVDISGGNLELAARRAKKLGLRNIEFKLISSFNDYWELEHFDFLFSTITFQHNPPPLQAMLLDCLLGKIRAGGGCLFQLATEHPGSSFRVDEYLQSDADGMEMHSLPMRHVFRLLGKHRFELLEVRPDGWTGETGSFTFFAFPKKDAREGDFSNR